MFPKIKLSVLWMPVLIIASISSAWADSDKHNGVQAPRPAVWVQECGSCHIAYPAKRLSAASWEAVMKGLPKHFGSDASVEPKIHAEILHYLTQNAGRKDTTGETGKPLLRITETRWFQKEHSKYLAPAAWKSPQIKSAANCMACHRGADKGDFSERNITIPKGVQVLRAVH